MKWKIGENTDWETYREVLEKGLKVWENEYDKNIGSGIDMDTALDMGY